MTTLRSHTREEYSAIKKKAKRALTTTRMNAENLTLSEINHTGQDKNCMAFYLDILSKYLNSQRQKVECQKLRTRGNEEMMVTGTHFHLQDE